MTAARWILSATLVLLGVGYVVVFLLASNFRRSFGASPAGPLLLIVPLLILGALAWWISPRPWIKPAIIQPAALNYPVLLVDGNKIDEVCLNADELTLRPENTDHVMEERFHVVDATGRRFRIQNYRSAESRPSPLRRYFNATFYNVMRFKVAFDLRLEQTLTREEVIAQLRDRDWTLPAATTSLADLFLAYRADRFREYGNSRDRMPEGQPSTPSKP